GERGASVRQDPTAANALLELVASEGVSGPCHDVDLHAALCRPAQPLDDRRVLIALVLDEQAVACPVDELTDAVAPGPRTPHKMTVRRRVKRLAMPIRLEAVDDFDNLVRAARRD